MSTTTSHISLSSKDRTNTSDNVSNYTFRLANPIRDVIAISIDSINFPISYYTVMTGINDTIVVEQSSVEYTATLVQGNYTAAELAAEAQTRIRAAFSPDNLHTVVFTALTQKFVIATGGSAFTINWSNSTANADKLFGFNNTDTASATSHTAPNIFNLSHTNFIYIISNKLSSTSNIVGSKNKNTIFVLNQNASFGSFVSYENQGMNWILKYSEEKNLYEIDLKVEFEDENEVPMNGIDWSISFRILRTNI